MSSLSEYEAQHIQNLAKLSGNIKALYFRYIEKIFQKTTGLKLTEGQKYDLDRYPAFKKQFDDLLKQMSVDMQGQIVNGIKQEWQLSNSKNDDWLNMVIKDRTLPEAVKERFFDKNIPAMNQFLARKEAGFSISDRIWNRAQQFRQQVETQLFEGITEGRSASSMATDLKRNLSDPDKLFRRVRDKYGDLKLSRAAKQYHPGQGKYRSSYQNALRLSRTEVNMSYRASDHERWKKTNFILGFEVKLSGNHPVIDICDDAKGKYPKEFKFIGWHPACRCYAVPIRPTEDQMGEYFDHIMDGGSPSEFKFSGQVENVPPGLTQWLDTNKERIAGWKNTPYFIRDNFKAGNQGQFASAFKTVEPIKPAVSDKPIATKPKPEPVESKTKSPKTKEDTSLYREAKTIQEAEQVARDMGIKNVSYKGFDDNMVDVANDINKSAAEHLKKYPELKKKMNFIGSQQGRYELQVDLNVKKIKEEFGSILPDADIRRLAEKKMLAISSNTYACSYNAGDIQGVAWNAQFNSKKALASLKKDISNKFHPTGCDNIKSLIDHEFGHRVDLLGSVSGNSKFLEIYKKYNSKGMDYVKNNLSKYAYTGNDPIAEFIAESWAEYLNNPTPRGISKEVGDLIISLLK